MTKRYSAYIEAIAVDQSLPIEEAAVELWLKDLANPGRWSIRPLLQFFLAMLLHVVWFLKRLPLPQFRAHKLLQKLICWFCRYFVSAEANALILRHFATESNILNFLTDNCPQTDSKKKISPVSLYPKTINDMIVDSFVEHDQELFRTLQELGALKRKQEGDSKPEKLSWQNWQKIGMSEYKFEAKKTQVMDFETAHALFMCLFCLLLTRDEYRDAINGFSLDQSVAIQVGKLIEDPTVTEYAYNKYPHYLVGPWNLTQRFIMHGFFTEYMYARLEQERTKKIS